MRKGMGVWVEMSGKFERIVGAVIAFLVFTILYYYVEPHYYNYISRIVIYNRYNLYHFMPAIILLASFLLIEKIYGDAVAHNYLLHYWLSLNMGEYYVYLFMDTAGYYCLYVIIMMVASRRVLGSGWLAFILYSAIYITLTYLIFSEKYKRICLKKSEKLRHRLYSRENIILRHIKKSSHTELVYLGWQYRYETLEGILVKIFVVAAGIGLAIFTLPIKLTEIILFALLIFSTFIEDNYWKREINNAVVLERNGITFCKYFLMNYISAIIYHVIGVSFFYGLILRSVEGTIIFLVSALFLVGFWMSAYLHLYLSDIKNSEILKSIFLLVMLVIEFVPVVNIFVGIYLLKKANEKWRRY